METSAQGRRPVRLHPWVGPGIAQEGHRGDGAPDCGAAYLRAKAQPGFQGAKEATPTPALNSPTTPPEASSAFAPGGPAPQRWSSGYGASGRSANKWRRTDKGGWSSASSSGYGGGRCAEEQALRSSAPAEGANMSAAEAGMLAKNREQLRIGALSGAAATSMPMGINAQGQILFRSEEERRANRELERAQRRQGLRR